MCAVPSMVVFCSSFLCFPGILLWCSLNDFKIVIVVSVITGYHFFFSFLMCCFSILRPCIFKSSRLLSCSRFLSPESAVSINRYDHFVLSQIVMSSVLFGMALSVFAC
jgi:hypothetical protein